ncbi:MAG: hypothetical protein FWH11_06040 [Micrococcales bacterium]|nr:hypothetical protein [Micrococcales bacterium]
MSTRSAPTSVAASDADGRGPSCGGLGAPGTGLSGKVSLLSSGTRVRVRLDAGAVAGPDRPAAVPSGGYGWGWRDEAGTTSRGAGIRRLGVADAHGVAVSDVSDAVAARVMPLLRVGPLAGIATVLSDLVSSLTSADLDALAHGVDYTEAFYPPDLPSGLDAKSAAGWGLQIYSPGTSLPTTADLDDAGLGPVDELWAGALDYGSADDEAPGSDVWWSYHE